MTTIFVHSDCTAEHSSDVVEYFEVLAFLFSHRSAPVRVLIYYNKLLRAKAVSILPNSLLISFLSELFGVLENLTPEVGGVLSFVLRDCVHIVRFLVPLLELLCLISLLGSFSSFFVILFVSYVGRRVSIGIPPGSRLSFLFLLLILDVLTILIPVTSSLLSLVLGVGIRVGVLVLTVLALVLKVRVFFDLVIGARVVVSFIRLTVVIHVVILVLLLVLLVHLLLHILSIVLVLFMKWLLMVLVVEVDSSLFSPGLSMVFSRSLMLVRYLSTC